MIVSVHILQKKQLKIYVFYCIIRNLFHLYDWILLQLSILLKCKRNIKIFTLINEYVKRDSSNILILNRNLRVLIGFCKEQKKIKSLNEMKCI